LVIKHSSLLRTLVACVILSSSCNSQPSILDTQNFIRNIFEKNIDLVKEDLSKFQNIENISYWSGDHLFYPINVAVESKSIDMVKLLLESNVKLNIKDHNGYSPLHWACQSNNLDIIEILIRNGIDVNIQALDGSTALHIAVLNEYHDSIDLLLNNGADAYLLNANGLTPFYLAIKQNKAEIIEIFMNNDVDPTKMSIDDTNAMSSPVLNCRKSPD
jgi:ankyrin repeat protein